MWTPARRPNPTPGAPASAAQLEEWQLLPARSDEVIAYTAWQMSGICAILTLATLIVPEISIGPPLVLLFFLVIYLNARKRLRDLVLVEGIVLTLYSLTPYSGSVGADTLSNAYGREGGNFIHNLAIIGYFLGIRFSTSLLPTRQLNLEQRQRRLRAYTLLAAMVGAALSILLSLVFIAMFGFVIGGSVGYSDGFGVRAQTGVGALLLSVPLAIASLSLVLARERKFLSPFIVPPLIAFLFLFVAHGERKYIILPVMLSAIALLRLSGIGKIVGLLVGIIMLWVLFCYFGYLRTADISITKALDPTSLSLFMRYSDQYLAGETLMLLATGSAAYLHVIDPLPWGGDYLLAWTMALPRFLTSIDYDPANVRFAYAWNWRTAEQGQGWGFDFWGEAYLVGNAPMVVFMAIAMTFLFRYLYVRSNERGGQGLVGAIAISGAYYALWFQRNAIAYFIREYVVIVILVTTLLVVAARILVDATTVREPGPQAPSRGS